MTGETERTPGGKIVGISGPTIIVRGLKAPAMFNLVRVGHTGLVGEIIRLEGDVATIQVYEETDGLSAGEPVIDSGLPLSVELGPGLLGNLYDGIQRPLEVLRDRDGPFIGRGSHAPPIDRERRWEFSPRVREGQEIVGGDIIGTVRETDIIEHHVLAPPDTSGAVAAVHPGTHSVDRAVVVLDDGTEITMLQRWPVRVPRPFRRKLDPDRLFITGQRVLDTFFPLAEGGTAAVPGGFGTGKTVVQHSLARYAAADIIVFVGCGERGNEIAEVLAEFPGLIDPCHGLPLIQRTVIIANTSNMPVAAREASIYTGATIAEYYRDQGYRVALMADSISRWAEALREIASRLEELPGEEGYPTYLATRLAGFGERAGRAACAGSEEREGSVTMIWAVSPPGGDFSEPVTQASMRVAGTLWALDPALAHRRHFPAVNPRLSYSLFHENLSSHLSSEAAHDWTANALEAISLLQKEEDLQEVVQLVGIDSIPDRERIILESGKMIREAFLVQNAFHENDSFCPLPKQYGMLGLMLRLHRRLLLAVENEAGLEELLTLPIRDKVSRLKEQPAESAAEFIAEVSRDLDEIIDTSLRPSGENRGSEGDEP